jgi:hypothetical protein
MLFIQKSFICRYSLCFRLQVGTNIEFTGKHVSDTALCVKWQINTVNDKTIRIQKELVAVYDGALFWYYTLNAK